jgi:hypothetical protein
LLYESALKQLLSKPVVHSGKSLSLVQSRKRGIQNIPTSFLATTQA